MRRLVYFIFPIFFLPYLYNGDFVGRLLIVFPQYYVVLLVWRQRYKRVRVDQKATIKIEHTIVRRSQNHPQKRMSRSQYSAANSIRTGLSPQLFSKKIYFFFHDWCYTVLHYLDCAYRLIKPRLKAAYVRDEEKFCMK